MAPNIKRVYVPYDSADSATAVGLKAIQDAAPKIGVELVTQEIKTADDIAPAIASIPDNEVDAVFLLARSIVGSHLNDFIQASLQNKLPMGSPIKSHIDAGLLLSYSFADEAVGKRAARLPDKILKGTKPADLPVDTSEFFLSLNLKTAQAIGITIPDEVLRQAGNIVR